MDKPFIQFFNFVLEVPDAKPGIRSLSMVAVQFKRFDLGSICHRWDDHRKVASISN